MLCLYLIKSLASQTAKAKAMKNTKNTKLTLSEVAEKNITTFNQDNFLNHEIGRLNDGNDGQIICYVQDFVGYIALINPQDGNSLFFSDEFPYYSFPQHTQDAIDKMFQGYL